jgi:hypothetical protein
MFYIDHSTDGPYDPAAAPLFGAIAGYEIPGHPPTASWDTTDPSWNNFSIPPENTSDVCYCGHQATPHGVGREHHGSVHVPTPEGGAQDAYDRFENGTNVVPQ